MNESLIKTGLAIVDRASNAIIASIDEAGFPNLKAMLKPRENDGLRTFYFTTNTSSRRVEHYLNNCKASIYFYDGRLFQGIMLKGEMEVLQDQSIKDRIWRDGDGVYYSKGVTDDDYCVLKFTTSSCRIYGNFKSDDFEV